MPNPEVPAPADMLDAAHVAKEVATVTALAMYTAEGEFDEAIEWLENLDEEVEAHEISCRDLSIQAIRDARAMLDRE